MSSFKTSEHGLALLLEAGVFSGLRLSPFSVAFPKGTLRTMTALLNPAVHEQGRTCLWRGFILGMRSTAQGQR